MRIGLWAVRSVFHESLTILFYCFKQNFFGDVSFVWLYLSQLQHRLVDETFPMSFRFLRGCSVFKGSPLLNPLTVSPMLRRLRCTLRLAHKLLVGYIKLSSKCYHRFVRPQNTHTHTLVNLRVYNLLPVSEVKPLPCFPSAKLLDFVEVRGVSDQLIKWLLTLDHFNFQGHSFIVLLGSAPIFAAAVHALAVANSAVDSVVPHDHLLVFAQKLHLRGQ